MTYTKIIVKHHRRKPEVVSICFEGHEDVPGMGRCRSFGLLCEVYPLSGGLVVICPLSRKPIKIERDASSLAEWLAGFGCAVESVLAE